MSVLERSSSTSTPVREIDPLLKDLNEKKLSFRKNVVSLAAELKGVRNRLASQEQSFAKETETRQVGDFWVWLLFFMVFELFRFSFFLVVGS
jgi:hypothetical protein